MPHEPRWRRYLRFHVANPAADLDAVRADVVFAVRQLRRAPAFAAVAVVSIALGVGLNVAIFSLANGLLLRPLPGVRADGLRRLYVNHHGGFEWRDLAWIRDHATLLEGAVGERLAPLSMETGQAPERVVASFASRGFFQTLGVRMALGRAFDVDERQGGEAVVVLSHAAWRSRFGGDSSIVGKSVRLAGRPFTVVGVAAPEFASSVFGWSPSMWIPLASMPLVFGTSVDDFRGSFYATVRLRAPAQSGAAAAELSSLAAQLRGADTTRFRDFTLRLDGVRGVNAELRGPAEVATGFLLAMVGLVLIIACANVANLLLSRAAARRAEIGVRLALGANRGRIIRQLLTESLMLACIGAAVGLSLAALIVRVVVYSLPSEAGLSLSFSPDRNVFAFALAATAGSVILFGLAPARRAASMSLSDAFRPDHDNVGGHRARVRGVLIGGQMALCAVLLATASLLSESFLRSRGVDPGFVAAGVQDVALDLGKARDTASGLATLDRVTTALRSLPSVTDVALAAIAPLSGSNMSTPVAFDGVVADSRTLPSTYFNVVGPRYFATLGIAVVRGREFAAADVAAGRRVAVVNETAARRWWPNDDAVGKRFRWGGAAGPIVEVIGVARDTKYNTYGEDPTPFVYLALAQNYSSEIIVHVRAGPAMPPNTLRAAVLAVDPRLAAPTIKPLTDEIALALLPARLGAALVGAFGAVALIIAASGIYGVTSYSVSRRTREIGIRSALGASRARLLGLVVGEGLRTAAMGAGVGLLFAIAVGLALSRVLYGVSAAEPAMLLGVPAILSIVAVAACVIPARRAASIDPVRAMRAE